MEALIGGNAGMKVEIDIDIDMPKGYEIVGYNYPKYKELYISFNNNIDVSTEEFMNSKHFIVKKTGANND
jgi:hypothetical protein